MSLAYDFCRRASFASVDEFWQLVVEMRGEPYPDAFRPEGTGVVVVFPDHSSIFGNDLKSARAQVQMRST